MKNSVLYTAVVSAFLMVGCNDNDTQSKNTTNNPDPSPTQNHISGTVAAGAPLIGQVTIIDAKNEVKTVEISERGEYIVDVNGMQAPFILKAEGYASGVLQTFCSIALHSDINGTINITPYTDLIVANAAGFKSDNCEYTEYVRQSGIDGQLSAANNVLANRLQEVLEQINLPIDIDFTRAQFVADHTGMDELLDAIQVIIDSETQTAVIKDVINNNKVFDDISNPTDNTPLPIPLRQIKEVGTALKSISARLALFSSHFENSLPQTGQIKSYFASDDQFLQAGQSLDEFFDDILSNPENKGLKLQAPRLLSANDDNELTVRVQIANNNVVYGYEDFVFVKEGTFWQNKGNQRYIDQVLESVNTRTLTSKKFHIYTDKDGNPKEVFTRQLEIGVSDAPSEVKSIEVTHPALNRSITLRPVGGYIGWGITKDDGSVEVTSLLSECNQQAEGSPCINFGLVKPDSEFTFTPRGEDGITTLLDEQGRNILKPYTMNLMAIPVSNSTAGRNKNNWFASVSSISPSDPKQLSNGTQVTVNFVRPTAKGYIFDYISAGVGSRGSDDIRPKSGNTVSFSWAGGSVNRPDGGKDAAFFNFWSRGANNRTFVTRTFLNED